MKTLFIFNKSFKEQIRSYWILLLSLSMGPFFIFIYYLITETSKLQYDILIINNDKGIFINAENLNHGNLMVDSFKEMNDDSVTTFLKIAECTDTNDAIEKLKNNKADALLIIDTTFSNEIYQRALGDTSFIPNVEFLGDLTNTNYLISAIWINEMLNEYILQATHSKKIVKIKETPLGISANVNDFDIMVPGILIVSLIMLMFTASIAFVAEIENKTMIRLKLSRIKAIEFLGGIGMMQLVVGITSVFLTLIMAIMLGFKFTGSLWLMVIVACLTSISIIAFSLIIAALTKTAIEVLVVANFPMFLFMFFTGAAFPFNSHTLFNIAGYPINWQSLMTPTHAISALNKTLIMKMNLKSIIPEILAILILTFFYFVTGALIFKRRHLK